jgi:hypothetical protein
MQQAANLDFLSKEQVRLHIYKLPATLNRGYAFNGGNDVPFLNVDFFDAPWDIPREDLLTFIMCKRYFNPYARFLVLAESKYPTLSFTIEPTADPAEEPRKE